MLINKKDIEGKIKNLANELALKDIVDDILKAKEFIIKKIKEHNEVQSKYEDQRFTHYLEENNYIENLIFSIKKNGFIEHYKKFAKKSVNFDENIIKELNVSLESIFQLPSLIMTVELISNIEGNNSLSVKQYDRTHPNILETPGYIHFLYKNVIKEDYVTFQSNPVFHFDIHENLSFPVNAFVEEYIKPLHFWKSQYELILACEKLELSRYNIQLVLGIIENLPEFIIYNKNVN